MTNSSKSYIAAIFATGILLAGSAFAATDAVIKDKIIEPAAKLEKLESKTVRKIVLPAWYHEGLFIDGANIWIVNGRGGKIWVYDRASGALVKDITPVAGFTEGVARGPSGTLFLTDWYEHKLFRVRQDGDRLVSVIFRSFGEAFPAGVATDGRDIFVITWTRGMGTKFRIVRTDEGGTILDSYLVRGIQEPAHMAWDGKVFWVTSWYSPRIYRLDPATWTITGYFHSPVQKTTGIAWDGKYLWVTGTSGDLYCMERPA